MPNDECPVSTSSGDDQGSDGESSSGRCDSMTSASEMDCSRESFTSNSSSKHCSPSCESQLQTSSQASMLLPLKLIFFLLHLWFLAASPPKTLTLDEVMESARDLSNLSIAHEITVNPDFRVEQSSPPQGRYVSAGYYNVLIDCIIYLFN